MDEASITYQDSGASVRRAGVWVLAAFWLVQSCELAVVGLIQGWNYALHQLPERLVIVSAGMILSLLLVEIAARLEGRHFHTRFVCTIAAALAMCAVLMVFAYQVAKLPVWGVRDLDVAGFVYVGFAWSWFFLSVASAILARSYSAEVGAGGERQARLEVVARDARLAALRYQINPHFLFNSLNSIASLVTTGDHAVAETMVENLADFLRATLETDPVDDIPLARELELQRLYLAVEQARFPERLAIEFDIPELLSQLPVPALIIQPLVENAIYHAVARSSQPVTIKVSASAIAGWLAIRVENDGSALTGPPVKGTGTGLRNVRERLATKFGTEQLLVAESLSGGGYRTEIRIPVACRSDAPDDSPQRRED